MKLELFLFGDCILLYGTNIVNGTMINKTLDIFNFSFLHLIISHKKQKQFDISRTDQSRLKALHYSTLVFSTRCSEFAYFSGSFKLCLTIRTTARLGMEEIMIREREGENWINWQSMSATRLWKVPAKWVLHVYFTKMLLVQPTGNAKIRAVESGGTSGKQNTTWIMLLIKEFYPVAHLSCFSLDKLI